MSAPLTLKVELLGKKYPVNCDPSQELALLQAARLLDEKLGDIRDSGKVIGIERITLMAALNLAHELINTQQEMTHLQQSAQAQLNSLTERVDFALNDI